MALLRHSPRKIRKLWAGTFASTTIPAFVRINAWMLCAAMVSEAQVRSLILKSPANPIGQKVRKFDRKAIEQVLKQNPWVQGIQSTAINGSCLTITITTNTPLALVFPSGQAPLVLADNGQLLADDSRCSNLLVINGNVGNCKPRAFVKKKSPLHGAYTVAKTIASNKDYAAQYPEIFVRPDGQIELYSVQIGRAHV